MTRMVPATAGPTSTGMARGTTAGSLPLRGFGTAVRPCASCSADTKSSAPAPTRKESSVMPKSRNTHRPKKKTTKQAMSTATVDRTATPRRSAPLMPSVRVRNTDSAKKGVRRKKNFSPTLTKKPAASCMASPGYSIAKVVSGPMRAEVSVISRITPATSPVLISSHELCM